MITHIFVVTVILHLVNVSFVKHELVILLFIFIVIPLLNMIVFIPIRFNISENCHDTRIFWLFSNHRWGSYILLRNDIMTIFSMYTSVKFLCILIYGTKPYVQLFLILPVQLLMIS